MKKTIFTLSLLLIAATLIFTGCSSKGDFELERSKGIKITYIDEFEKTTILPAPLTSEEIFNSYSDTIVRGTIETVRNIQIDYGKGEIAQKALATIKITKVISGNAKADSTVTVLLPKCVDNASANDSSVVISHLENGTEGIFLLKEVTEQSCAEINGKTFYYDDICEYSMFGEDHFAVICPTELFVSMLICLTVQLPALPILMKQKLKYKKALQRNDLYADTECL